MDLPRAIYRAYFRYADPSRFLRGAVFQSPPSSTAGNVWDDFSAKIAAEVTADPSGFLRQPTIKRCVHPHEQKLAARLLDVMATDDEFCVTLAEAAEPSFGNPFSTWIFPRLSPTALIHLYYLYLAKKKLGFSALEADELVEIGGGYGGFCRLSLSLGMKGRYTIVDLPSMHALQRHYLDHTARHNGIERVQFMTTDEYQPLRSARSILFATFSVNEMPLSTRKTIETWLSNFSFLFFAYNSNFDGVDNLKYFENLGHSIENEFEVSQFVEPDWGHFMLASNRKLKT